MSQQIAQLVLQTKGNHTSRGQESFARSFERRRRDPLPNSSKVPAADVLSDGFLLLDEQFRVTHANEAAIAALGTRSKPLIGMPLTELRDRTDLAPALDFIHQAFETREPRRARVEDRSTGKLWQIKTFPVQDGVALFFRDVTDEDRARGWLHLLNVAVDRINDLVMVTDGAPLRPNDGPRVLYVNKAFEEVTGFSRDEVIGTCPIFLQDGGAHVPGAGPIVEAVSQRKEVRGELRCHTRNGQDLWLEIDMVPLFDAAGQLTNWVSLKRDITERRRMEQHLREAEGFRSIARMSGKIAHDFNNLLSVIMGNCDAIVDMAEPGSALQELAERSLRASERGAKLTTRLQAFGGTQQLFPESCNLAEVVANSLERFRTELSPQIALDMDSPPGIWSTKLDRQRLSASIHELLCNARDAIGDAGRISVTLRNIRVRETTDEAQQGLPDGAFVKLSIIDTGCGMTREQIDSATRPFFSTKEHGVASGLGLSGALGFARQSGGQMQIDSALGRGSTVSFFFPAEEETSAEEPRPDASPKNIELTSAHNMPRGLQVLLVEDDPQVRQNLVRNLEQRGLHVTAAENATEALRTLIRSDPPDLMISDIIMPGDMDGIALAQIARRYVPKMKVLLISGFADRQVAAGVADDPGIAFMQKPFRLDGLLARISELRGT